MSTNTIPESKGFKITGHYLYPPVESTQTFPTKEAASAENRRWTAQAAAQGLRWKGRVIPVKPN